MLQFKEGSNETKATRFMDIIWEYIVLMVFEIGRLMGSTPQRVAEIKNSGKPSAKLN